MAKMWECSSCGEYVEEDFDVCWKCQSDRQGALLTEVVLQDEDFDDEFESEFDDEELDSIQSPEADTGNRGPGQLEYKIVPFMGRTKQHLIRASSAEAVSRQLQKVIDLHINNGWELQAIEQVFIELRPGCLGALMGRESQYRPLDQIVFRRNRVE